MTATDVSPLLVPVAEASTILGIGRNSMYELVKTGELASISIGRRILIPRAALTAFAEAIAQGTVAAEASK